MSDHYTHAELSFAMQVRTLALEMQLAEAPDNLEAGSPERLKWLMENPIESYYPRVLQGVKATASSLRKVLAAS